MILKKCLLGFSVSVFFSMTFLPVSSCLAYRGGSGLPSCHDDIASSRVKAGNGPECTPPILDQETAAKIIKEFTVKKIKGKWYLFLSHDEFATVLDAPARWKTISLLVSSVQSLFGENADCFIARIPESEEEKQALLEGEYPVELIGASGLHVELTDADNEAKKWPEYHHHVLYRLSVFE